MKRQHTKIKKYFFLLFFLIFFIPVTGQNGTIGSINWHIKENTLIFSGHGTMPNYNYYNNIPPWSEYRNSISSIKIGKDITSIGTFAFSFFEELTSVEIPDDVQIIGSESFYGCKNLSYISIPGSITYIGSGSFSNCSKLSSITINSSEPPSLGTGVFSGVNKSRCNFVIPFQMDLETYLSADKQWAGFDNYYYMNPWGTTGDLSWKIENNILTISGNGDIPDYAYYSTHYKDNSPWYNWTNSLTKIIIEEGVTSIGNYAFNGCNMITSVSFPETLASIGSNAFYYCTALTSITIGEKLTDIDVSAFTGCWSINSFTVNPGNKNYTSTDGILFNKTKTQLLRYPAEKAGSTYIVDNTVTSIADNAFERCLNLKSITIQKNVSNIGRCAFGLCEELHLYFKSQIAPALNGVIHCEASALAIHIPDESIGYTEKNGWIPGLESNDYFESGNIIYSLVSKEDKTFQVAGITDHSLTNAVVKEMLNFDNEIYNVTQIGKGSFKECYLLEEIFLPNTIKTIDEYAFAGCNFKSIDLPESIISIGDYAFAETQLESLDLPRYIVRIGERAFAGCTELESIVIPETVSHTGNFAFDGCSKIQSVTLYSMINFSNVFTNCDRLKSVIIGETIETINNSAFINCNTIQSVAISENVKNIGYNAFSGCTGLKSVNLPKKLKTINDNVFYNCKKLDIVIIPDSISVIGNFSFYGCSGLTHATIPATVNSVGNYAFYNCESLTSINIPESVKIGDYAFAGCNGLTSVRIPNSINGIGTNAFQNCYPQEVTTPVIIPHLLTRQLEKLTVLSSELNNIGEHLLSDCENLKELTLPFIGLSPNSTGEDAVLGSIFGKTANNNMKAVTQCYEEGKATTYYIPANLEKLTITSPAALMGYGALYNCSSIKELTISSSVTGIAEKALYGCSGLEHIYVQRALPPAAFDNTFDGIGTFSCTLHVPTSSKKYYENATGWKNFFMIQEEAPLKITAVPVPLNGGIIIGYDEYERNMPASLEAIAHSGYDFKCWMEGENVVFTNPVYNFTATVNRDIYAVFVPKENADESVTITTQPTSADIIWEIVENARNYLLVIYSDEAKTEELYRVKLDVNGNVIRSTKAVLNHTVKGLNPQTPYYYTITSYNEINQALTISTGNFLTTEPGTTIGKDIPTRPNSSIYPNPVKEILFINSVNPIKTAIIYDNTGRPVNTERTENSINVSNLSNGFYIIKIDSGENIDTFRFLKN